MVCLKIRMILKNLFIDLFERLKNPRRSCDLVFGLPGCLGDKIIPITFAKVNKSLDKDSVFTENWWDPDHYEMCRKRSAACAEALVPDQLPPSKITGIYVSSEEAYKEVASIIAGSHIDIPIIINGKIFFKEA